MINHPQFDAHPPHPVGPHVQPIRAIYQFSDHQKQRGSREPKDRQQPEKDPAEELSWGEKGLPEEEAEALDEAAAALSRREAKEKGNKSLAKPPEPIPVGAPPITPDRQGLPFDALPLLRQVANAVRRQAPLPEMANHPLPRTLSVVPDVDLEIFPAESPPYLRLKRHVDSVDAPNIFHLEALEAWLNKEISPLSHRLRFKYDDRMPPEFYQALELLPPTTELDDWKRLAVLLLLGYDELELRGQDFNAHRLEALILAELLHYYEEGQFKGGRRPNNKVPLLEKKVNCTLKTAAAAAGIPLLVDEISYRNQHIQRPWIMLQQRSAKGNLEESLGLVEDRINWRIKQKKRELELKYAPKKLHELFADFKGYTWEDLAAYAVIRNLDLDSHVASESSASPNPP